MLAQLKLLPTAVDTGGAPPTPLPIALGLRVGGLASASCSGAAAGASAEGGRASCLPASAPAPAMNTAYQVSVQWYDGIKCAACSKQKDSSTSQLHGNHMHAMHMSWPKPSQDGLISSRRPHFTTYESIQARIRTPVSNLHMQGKPACPPVGAGAAGLGPELCRGIEAMPDPTRCTLAPASASELAPPPPGGTWSGAAA